LAATASGEARLARKSSAPRLPALPIAYWFGELAPKLAQSWRERPDGFLAETDLSHLTIAVPSTARLTVINGGHAFVRAGSCSSGSTH